MDWLCDKKVSCILCEWGRAGMKGSQYMKYEIYMFHIVLKIVLKLRDKQY